MKKTSLLFCSIAFLLLFAGCQSEDQSLTTDSFKTNAVLQGNVYYSLGQDFVNGKYLVDKRMKASGKTIYVDVQSSEYKPGSTGIITYSAKIDSTGNYKFTIPVKTQGTTAATIRMEQFLGNRQVYDQMVAGTPTFKAEQVLFSFTKGINLSNGSLTVQNFNYSFSPVDIPATYTDSITLKGTLNLAYEKGFRDGAFKAASGQSVEVSVNYSELGGNFNFGTTVDQNGNYSIQIPVASKKDVFNATIQPVGYIAKDYTHFTKSTTQLTLSGVYSCAPESISIPAGMSESPNNIDPLTLFFSPSEAPSTWTTNLAGWVQLDPTVYKYPVTLTGNVFAAYEKSYLVGDYNPMPGKTITVTVNMGSPSVTQSYIVSTDNSGKYSVPVMLPQKNMNINVSVSAESYSVSNYTHYKADGTSLQLNGWYDTNYFDISNTPVGINEFSTTYTMDNLYRMFTPVNVSGVNDWNTNLVGWYQIPGEKGFVNITGAVKKAVEGAPNTSMTSSWQVATWANATNQPFYITVAGKTLLGITNSTGQYNLSYPLNYTIDASVNNNLTVSLSSSIANAANFIHYSSMNSVASTIQGSYAGSIISASCPIVDGTTCTVNDCKMFFSPNVLPAGWIGYIWK